MTDAEGNAFSEPYEQEDELSEEADVWKNNTSPIPEKPSDTVARERTPRTSVLYRFLTNRKTEDGFMISDRESSNQ